MKNNECFVKLIPMNNIGFLDLRKLAKIVMKMVIYLFLVKIFQCLIFAFLMVLMYVL